MAEEKEKKKKGGKKFTMIFRALFAGLLTAIMLCFIGMAKIFGVSSPKVSTFITYFTTTFLCTWAASAIVKSLNQSARKAFAGDSEGKADTDEPKEGNGEKVKF